MKSVIITLLLSVCGVAQVFPSNVAGNKDLYVAVAGVSTSLLTAATSSTTTFTVASTLNIVPNELLLLGGELVLVCSVNSGAGTFSVGYASCPNVDGRGKGGTAAASYGIGQAVKDTISFLHHNAPVAEIEAVESALGAGLSNVPGTSSGPVVGLSKGGTGATSQPTALTAILGTSPGSHTICLGEGSGPMTCLSPGTSGYALTSNGASADPSYQKVALSQGSVNEVQSAGAAGALLDSGCSAVTGSMICTTFQGASGSFGGYIGFTQGTAPASVPANTSYFYAPASIPTTVGWTVPSADSAGAMSSNGSGVLTFKPFVGTDARVVTGATSLGSAGSYPCVSGNGGLTGTGCPSVSDPTAQSQFWLYESFPTTRPDLSANSTYSGSMTWYAIVGSIGLHSPPIAGLPGLLALSTTTSSNNAAYLELGYGSNAEFDTLGPSTGFTYWVTRNVIVPNPGGVGALTNMAYYFCETGAPGTPTNCPIGIASDTTSQTSGICTTSGTWSITHWNYISNGVCFDSGVAATSSIKYTFVITCTTPGTLVYTINGAASHTFSTGVYDSTASPMLSVITRTTAAATVLLNHFSFFGNGLTR